MGTGVRQSNHTRMDRQKCEALMRDAYDRGVRAFDLGDLYGTHPFVISALKKILRKHFVVITTIWFVPAPFPNQSGETSTWSWSGFSKRSAPITSIWSRCTVSCRRSGPRDCNGKWRSWRSKSMSRKTCLSNPRRSGLRTDQTPAAWCDQDSRTGRNLHLRLHSRRR